ncbi:MAG TPA: DUF58 domain-containing protein [Burkholderiales bacterium]|nr:DUF58 domain-containing protein [Burkholderiales bacterium]
MPRGVKPSLAALLELRRYGAAMRKALALDEPPRAAGRVRAARSHGMEYAESRPYSPGDDVRRFDWRVTARTGRAHTKVFRLEHGNDLHCLIDQRRSMHFGTRAAFKSVVAAELAALAGWAAAAGGDRFGATLAGAREAAIPMGSAEASVAALCSAICTPSRSNASDPDAPLDALATRALREAAEGTRFLVVSDFADAEPSFARAVKLLRTQGPLVLLWVIDPLEERLPPPGRYPLTDGRAHLMLDTSTQAVRAAHGREFAERRERLDRLAREPGTRCMIVRTGEDLFSALARSSGGLRLQ